MSARQLCRAGGLRYFPYRSWTVCAALLAFLPGAAGAAEAVLAADFKKLDLTQIPDGWALKDPADVSIADDPAKGKVLRICHKGGGQAALEIKLDLAKVRGSKVRASVLAKCTTPFKAVPERYGWPQIMISYHEPGGANRAMIGYMGASGPEWQNLVSRADVPANADAASVCLRVVEVAADVLFDQLQVEAEGALPASPAGQAPATPAQAGSSGGSAAPVPPVGIAASAPRKPLEDEGVLFSPEIAAVLGAARKTGLTERSYAVVGPGAPLRGLEAKTPEKWSRVVVTGAVSGARASPENLISTLPIFVVAQKPEVVIIAGGAGEARKVAYHERYDYEDVARICLRLGVMPVFAVPPAGTQDELRREILEAARLSCCPVVELKTPALAPLRLQQLLGLLERHVFDRTAKAPAAKSGTGKQPVEE